MDKAQLLKHLQRVAKQSSANKKLNALHVRAIVEELHDVWAKSLHETGAASFNGFGRFDVQKGKGTIKFTPHKRWQDKIDGVVSSSADSTEGEGGDDSGYEPKH